MCTVCKRAPHKVKNPLVVVLLPFLIRRTACTFQKGTLDELSHLMIIAVQTAKKGDWCGKICT